MTIYLELLSFVGPKLPNAYRAEAIRNHLKALLHAGQAVLFIGDNILKRPIHPCVKRVLSHRAIAFIADMT